MQTLTHDSHPPALYYAPDGRAGRRVRAGPGRLLLFKLQHGRQLDVAFRGRGYEHAIDVNGSTRLTGVFADVRAARGETVRLRLDPAGCHLFPADQ